MSSPSWQWLNCDRDAQPFHREDLPRVKPLMSNVGRQIGSTNENDGRLFVWSCWVPVTRRCCNWFARLYSLLWRLGLVDVGILSARFRWDDSTFNHDVDAR